MDRVEGFKEAEAAAWLEHVSRLKARIACARESVEQAREMMLPKGIGFDGGGASGCYADALPDGVIRLQSAVERYASELSALLSEEEAALAAIGHVSSAHGRTALRLHYLCGKTWRETADAIGYSDQWIYSCRDAWLRELWPHIPPRWRTPMHPAV